MRTDACCAGHRTGNGADGATEFVRVPGNGHGTGSSTGFNHDDGCGERRHQSCASEEAVPGGHCSGWYLTDHEAEVGYPDKQFAVSHRVGAINAVCYDYDRFATGCQRRSMGSPFDAVRAAGHDCPLAVGEFRGQRTGHVLAVGGRGSRTGDREEITERSRQKRGSATSSQDERPPIAKIVECRWPCLLTGDQHADTHALGFEDALRVCLSV